MDMKWHANAYVQNSAKEEQISFVGGEHIDLKTTINIRANKN